ncbi:jacalin-like lectin [Herminiimonas aquatilis]|uniref:Jacalin-like lectin n=1 Tax=Herminiimonas aquatilis TaxID=345342 RepID=A0ABW2J3K7_9BURK
MNSSITAARLSVFRTIKKTLIHAGFLLLGSVAIQQSAYASDIPDIKPALKKMLGGLAIDAKDELQKMVGDLKKTTCGGGLTGCYQTKSGPIHLYFFTSNNTQQTFIIVVDKKIAMPKLFGSKVQNVMGQTTLRSLMISISTTDFDLTTAKMPPDLKKVVNDSYFGVSSINFSSGAQMAARADLGGLIKGTMEAFGVRGDQLTMRAAVVMPIPTDIAGGAGAGAGMASDVADGATMKKAGADATKLETFVEFQFAPNAKLPLLLPPMNLSDATFYINNNLTFGYKGNAQFKGVGDKKILIQFKTPLTPLGGMDLLDFEFRMATPASFTLEDAANVIFAMATPDPRLAKYGGGFIRNINSFKDPLLTMVKPLAMFKVKNPNPPPEYRFGDATKPWPDDNKYYNIALVGPLGQGGPYMSSAGEVAIFGQTMGWMEMSAGMNGYYSGAGRELTLRLGPLGKVPFKMSSENRIDQRGQNMTMMGNFAGQKIAVVMGMTQMSIEVNASCVNPFEIKASAQINPTTDLAKLFEYESGVNVDPSKITGCIGKELEAAYKKIAGEYKNLKGYTADMANKELKKIADTAAVAAKAAEDAEKAAAAEAKKQYENTKNAARDIANKTNNAANKAFNDAGNAFKRIGKKKKHKKGPDPKFAGSVFDWDYYYDTNPDLQRPGTDLTAHWKDSGFREGRRGSLEFSAQYYYNRYPDVQQLCKGNMDCALQHWLDNGIELGRQGSPDFNVVDYMNRYGDVPRTLAPEDDPDALEHWLTVGADAGRDGSPASNATGAFSPPTRAGGGGGKPWNDAAQCQWNYVIGFRISVGDRLDGVQFLYSNNQWGAVHGTMKNATADVTLPAGQYIQRVDYRSGESVDAVGFITNTGKTYGTSGIPSAFGKVGKSKMPGMPSTSSMPDLYGGTGGTFASYTVTPGEKLGCMTGRSGSEIDQLIFSSTGPR